MQRPSKLSNPGLEAEVKIHHWCHQHLALKIIQKIADLEVEESDQ